MNRQEKIEWMAVWAVRNGFHLVLDGEVGFGRPCVGILSEGSYPDYQWYDEATYERADTNGNVWCPPDAYHKHPCVAVLGTGEEAEAQLFNWLQWFDAAGFVRESGDQAVDPKLGMLAFALGEHRYIRLVRTNPVAAPNA